MNIKLLKREREASQVESFYFHKPKEFTYIAGQYVEIHLPHEDSDERGKKRIISFASSPTEETLLFTMKFYEAGSTYKQKFLELKKDDEIEIKKPMGTFTLPENKEEKLLFVAGGVGITPYRSMLKYLVDEDQERDITLIYAANSEEEFIFRDVLSSSPAETKFSTEWLNAEKIKSLAEDLLERTIYLSGPQPMIESLTEDLLKVGVKKKQIKLDYFPGYDSI